MPRPSDEYSMEQALRRQKDYLEECNREIQANEERVAHYEADKAATIRRIAALEAFLKADAEPLPPCQPFKEPNVKRKMKLKEPGVYADDEEMPVAAE